MDILKRIEWDHTRDEGAIADTGGPNRSREYDRSRGHDRSKGDDRFKAHDRPKGYDRSKGHDMI